MIAGWRGISRLVAVAVALAAGSAAAATGATTGPTTGAVPATRLPSFYQCTRYFKVVETTYGVPRGMLHAIAVVESGRNGIPWPWTLNIEGRAVYATSREEALALMHGQDGRLRSDVAIGCMQLFSRYHAAAFPVDDYIIDPATNVAYAGAFLRFLHDRNGSWAAAVRLYNAKNPQAQDWYLCRVLYWRARLGYQRQTPAMDRLCSSDTPPVSSAGAGIKGATVVARAPVR
ncbi:MAG: transglycosylase SLT domain-containing protein [Azospirillaceae bacterium]|nr:transglycosylase SLT domain-containing protein [Azospirillaceae bacterium]